MATSQNDDAVEPLNRDAHADSATQALAQRARVRSRVLALRQLSATGYELVLDRCDLDFTPGMNVVIHGADATQDREYTIASGIHDPELRILFRYIPTGRLTTRLVALRMDQEVVWSGPFGSFTVRDPHRPLVFVGTGTGISPCRAYLRSLPQLNLTIVHGVRDPEDLFYANEFAARPYVGCVTGGAPPTAFSGRVTDWLARNRQPPDAQFYLCGAFDMVHDVTALLQSRGISPSAIFAEPYYYGQPQ